MTQCLFEIAAKYNKDSSSKKKKKTKSATSSDTPARGRGGVRGGRGRGRGGRVVRTRSESSSSSSSSSSSDSEDDEDNQKLRRLVGRLDFSQGCGLNKPILFSRGHDVHSLIHSDLSLLVAQNMCWDKPTQSCG